MKEKQHAKDRREAGKRDWRMKPVPSEAACVVRQPALSKEQQAAMEAEETRQFLACLENIWTVKSSRCHSHLEKSLFLLATMCR